MRKLIASLSCAICLLLGCAASSAIAAGKTGTIVYDVELKVQKDAKTATLWLPYPMSDRNQDISNVMVSGNYASYGVYHDPKSGSNYLMATWNAVKGAPRLSMSFQVDSHYAKGGALKAGGEVLPAETLPYLAANDYLPADNAKVREMARTATKGARSILEKARAIYEWTIANTHRDPNVKGCGLGDAIRTLTEASGGGKCADISSVFITMARAAGVPARDVFGLRMAGRPGAVTGDFHCWAEFYLPGTGWVMADPADVRKAMLIEKLDDVKSDAVRRHTEFFWNGDSLFRIALNRGEHAVRFPGMGGDPVGYFMYPYAEADGKALDYFDPKNFSFTVTLK